MTEFSITEVAPGIFETRMFAQAPGISFNQYFLRGEKTALISLGTAQMFEGIQKAIQTLGGKTAVDYLVIPHFEGDECGSLSRWLSLYPQALPVCGEPCSRQLTGFDLHRKPKVVGNGETLDLGGLQLQFLLTPFEVHLWDGLMVLERRSGFLFSSDLFMQRGNTPLTVDSLAQIDPKGIQTNSIPAKRKLRATLDNLTKLKISAVAPGHGSVMKFNPQPLITKLLEQHT